MRKSKTRLATKSEPPVEQLPSVLPIDTQEARKKQKELQTQLKLLRGDILSHIKRLFDIRRYDSSGELDILGWANELAFRYMMYRHFKHIREERPKSSSQLNPLSILYQVLSNPLRSKKGSTDILLVSPGYRPVHDVQIYDVWDGRSQINNYPEAIEACQTADRQYAEGRFAKLPDPCWTSLHDYQRSKGFNAEDVWVRVCLAAPNDVLIESFETWLSEKRRTSPRSPPRNFTPSTLKKWSDSKVLAYIDLTAICEEFKLDLPNHEMGKLLFPDEYSVDLSERVRKVIKPLADELMTGKVLDALQIAAVSKTKRNKSNTENVPE